MIARPAARTARALSSLLAVAGCLTAPLLLPSAAWAAGVDDGAEPGDGLSVLETLLWFVGAPLALFAVIAVLVSAPSMARGPRYRPALGWWAAPVWFNGPDDADTAVRRAVPTSGGGGASARW
ncbi:MAG: hypothetical protein H0U35_05480 [Sporichthyaceae bacterium]|nr:hypothetical protein [Sporichthyaceae bacterium]